MLLVLFSLDLSPIEYLDTSLFITEAENSRNDCRALDALGHKINSLDDISQTQ
jgi:hypothetical protein